MFKKLRIKIIKKIRRIQSLSDVNTTSPNYATASAIFRMCLRHPDAEFLLRPVEHKRILKVEKKGIYIILEKTLLEISNHDFSFHLEIPYERFVKLSKMFDNKMDLLIEKEEQKIVSQVHSGLSKVLNVFKQPSNNEQGDNDKH